jgi:hypothetical protein
MENAKVPNPRVTADFIPHLVELNTRRSRQIRRIEEVVVIQFQQLQKLASFNETNGRWGFHSVSSSEFNTTLQFAFTAPASHPMTT